MEAVIFIIAGMERKVVGGTHSVQLSEPASWIWTYKHRHQCCPNLQMCCWMWLREGRRRNELANDIILLITHTKISQNLSRTRLNHIFSNENKDKFALRHYFQYN